jgi:hypothetical protein
MSTMMIYHHHDRSFDRSLLLPVLTKKMKNTFNRALILISYGLRVYIVHWELFMHTVINDEMMLHNPYNIVKSKVAISVI